MRGSGYIGDSRIIKETLKAQMKNKARFLI